MTFAEADLLPCRRPSTRGRSTSILANLPYVRHDAMAGLPRATSFEPALALDGGADGLEVIGRLLDRLPDALARRTASRSSRSGRTRARRSSTGRRRACPAGRARSRRTWPGCHGSPGSRGPDLGQEAEQLAGPWRASRRVVAGRDLDDRDPRVGPREDRRPGLGHAVRHDDRHVRRDRRRRTRARSSRCGPGPTSDRWTARERRREALERRWRGATGQAVGRRPATDSTT